MRTLFLLAAFLFVLSLGRVEAYSSWALSTSSNIRQLDMAIAMYRQDMGKFPSAANNFADLKDYLETSERERFSVDRWGNRIVYLVPGKHGAFDLYSFGANGIDEQGEGDDISNWAGIREGYYYKTRWPLGRRLLILSFPASLACLALGFLMPWRIVAPFAGIILCGMIAIACHFLSSPLVGDPVNDWTNWGLLGTFVFGVLFTIAFVTAFSGQSSKDGQHDLREIS